MNKIDAVLKMILDDPQLSEVFKTLYKIDDVKKFIMEIDHEITDDELSEYFSNTIFRVSNVSDDDLEVVSGGTLDRRILSWPMAALSAFSMAAGPSFAMNSEKAHASAIVSSYRDEKQSLGSRVLSWFSSELKSETNDNYMENGFLSKPTQTTLSDSMESRKKVFIDTLEYCLNHEIGSSIKYGARDFINDASKVIHYNHKNFIERFSKHKIRKHNAAKIWLTNGKSLQSLNAVNNRLKISPKNVKNTAVLNFANYYCPGGGVMQGCTAQEECLCRITNLYPRLATKSMIRDFYSKHTMKPTNIDQWRKSGIANEAIYTENVKQIKEDYTIGRVGEYVDGCKFNVITAAAPDFRMHDLDDNEIPQYKDLMKDLWRMIFSIAYEHGDKNLVLGALGCGAFKNDPKLVSEAFYDVLSEKGPGGEQWAYCFDNIILPIYTSNQNDQKNYEAFKEAYVRQYGKLYKMSQTELNLPSID